MVPISRNAMRKPPIATCLWRRDHMRHCANMPIEATNSVGAF